MVLFIIGLICFIASIVYSIIAVKKIINLSDKVFKGAKQIDIYLAPLRVGLACIISSVGLVIMQDFSLKFLEWFFLIFGSLLFGGGIGSFIYFFGIHYWKSNLDEKEKKLTKIIFIISAVVTLVGLWLLTEGIANQDIYPLINGVSTSCGFTYPNQYGVSGLTIKWYGIVIVLGALICYFITDHYTYKKFGEHGLIDTLFIVAFLCGLIGARLWYCLVLEPKIYLNDPASIITGIVDGGLAIQGGALLGMAGGIAFVLIFRKYIDVRFLMDVAIPTILIAQAIGRWGNFFNQEVYGGIAPSWLGNLLPTIIKNNLIIGGELRVPLFLIESIINICGFCIIRYVFGKLLKFRIGTGYQASLYPIWYGLVRVCLEKLRHGEFEYDTSWVVGFVMIGVGVAMLITMIIIHKSRMAKGLEDINGDKIKVAK